MTLNKSINNTFVKWLYVSMSDFSYHYWLTVSFQNKWSVLWGILELIQHCWLVFFIGCDPNNFQTPMAYSWTSRPILISTADVFKSLGSWKWNTSDWVWVNTSWFILRPAFPCFSRGWDFNSKKSATHKHILHRGTTSITPVFLFSLSPLCIELFSRGGWVLRQPLHLWKICQGKFNSSVRKMSSFYMAVDPLWTGGWAVVCCKLLIAIHQINMFPPSSNPNTSCNPEYIENTSVKYSYHRCCPTWNQCRGREVCSNGCYWPILCLSQQTVYVAGQTGSGAHGMVPQNKDCIIQSVQTILHPRLGAPEGLWSEGLWSRRREEKKGRAA